MSKFKVGDKVRFTKAECHCSDPCYYPPVGTIGTIVGDEKSSVPFIKWDEWTPGGIWKYIHGSNPGLAYSVDAWEGVLEEDQKIMIYIDKDDPHTVIARNIKTGARATARCAPQDHFDFYVGAKLAFDRLVGPPVEEKPKRKFKAGDVVVGNSEGRYNITHKGWFGEVLKVAKDGFIIVRGYDPYAKRLNEFLVDECYFDLFAEADEE